MLLLVAVWGWTFTSVKEAIEAFDVMGFLAIRFTIGAVAIGLMTIGRFCPRSCVIGCGVGGVLAASYTFQTYGLSFTTATNCGVITGLFILFVPLVNRALFGKSIERSTWTIVGFS